MFCDLQLLECQSQCPRTVPKGRTRAVAQLPSLGELEDEQSALCYFSGYVA